MSQLILMRHAHANPALGNQPDVERPLSPHGQQQALTQANWLFENDYLPKTIVSSPAKRTTSTAETLRQRANLDLVNLRFDGRIYEASPGKLLQVLQQQRPCQRLLLVGHNPGLEQLLCVLTGRPLVELGDGQGFTPATLAILSVETPWADLGTQSAHLLELIRIP